MPKRVGSLMEIARLCSVSKSTVSRVLNDTKQGRFSVSPQVRAKIIKTAQKLNYRPNIAARNLTIGKTRLVAILGFNGFWSDHVGPIDEAAAALSLVLDGAGYEIYIQFMTPRHNTFDPPPLRVDGIVAVSPQKVEDLEALERSEIPYVSLDGVVGKRGMRVLPDDTQGTYLALQHLWDLGHRRISYLDNPSVDGLHMSVFVRRKAFAQATKEMGFEVPILSGLPKLKPGDSWDMYYEPFLRSAVIEGKATAVLSYSHHGALALLRLAHDMGLSVPNDFSLLCFNNSAILSTSIPSLTAIDVPSIPLGQTAAEMLLKQLNSSDSMTSKTIKLEESLVLRESTAPPKIQAAKNPH